MGVTSGVVDADNKDMNPIGSAGGVDGVIQLTMLKKQMDMAKAETALLLEALPPAAPVHPGKVDVYA